MLSLMLILSFNFMFIRFNSVLVTKIVLIVVYKSLILVATGGTSDDSSLDQYLL
jgi:hypothetical protein